MARGTGLRITRAADVRALERRGLLAKGHVALLSGGSPNAALLSRVYDAIELNLTAMDDAMMLEPDGALRLAFRQARLISYNDLQRIDRRRINRYRTSWLGRVRRMVERHASTVHAWKVRYPTVMEVIRAAPRGPFLDSDSVVAGSKYLIDGIARAGLLRDDRQEHLVHTLAYQILGAPAVYVRLSPVNTPHGLVDDRFLGWCEDLSARSSRTPP